MEEVNYLGTYAIVIFLWKKYLNAFLFFQKLVFKSKKLTVLEYNVQEVSSDSVPPLVKKQTLGSSFMFYILVSFGTARRARCFLV